MSEGARDDAELVRQAERWFLRRGLPHLIEDYRASQDVFTRTVWVLVLIALTSVVSAARLDWPWWQNTLAVAGGVALLVGLFALVNHLRGRRPLQPPDDVGPVELALFVLLPSLVVLASGQLDAALGTAVGHLLWLGVVYLAASYGLVPMTRWALGRTAEAMGTVVALVGRALPLLLALTVLVFVNADAWRVAGALPGSLFALTGAMFVAVGLAFLLTRLPAEIRRLDEETSGDGAVAGCRGTPLEAVGARVSDGCLDGRVPLRQPPLTRRQRANVYLVLLFAQAVQVVLVSVAVFAFFTAFGVVAVQPVVVEQWLGEIGSETLLAGELLGHRVELTSALLQVSGFVALVAGFSFTVSMVADATYREEFFAEIVDQVRQALAVRTVYLAVRSGAEPPAG